MSVIEEILKWSESLGTSWTPDALRRIVTQPALSDDDIAELADLCKKPHGLVATQLQPNPLDAKHLPTGQEAGEVSLVSLTHVSDVNALAPNERMCFGNNGLTVVYGDNGAGKSGYARILKRACRARGSGDPILANALSDQAAGTPTASIVAMVGGVQNELLWKDGTEGPSYLGACCGLKVQSLPPVLGGTGLSWQVTVERAAMVCCAACGPAWRYSGQVA